MRLNPKRSHARRCAVVFLAAWTVAAAQSPSPPLDSIDQRVQPCMVCHGKEGRATSDGYYPRIAGKPAGYLFNQLINFRNGHRHFPMMTYLVERQSDAYLQEMADYFARQDLPYPPPQALSVPPAVLARGEQLVMEGDASQRIPACRSCHGARLVGVAPAVPSLLGLPRDYLMAQIGAWKNGTRRAAAPDCMAEVAKDLSPADVNAVASWLATQPVPENAKADAEFAEPPPRQCGSIPDHTSTSAP
ncbi:MAG: c-type cytochrome [Steroidobacteraceae bacterium]|nr:c-type cytochrome [Steroidobacteraceae bacterium]